MQRQFGTIPYVIREDEILVLMITSNTQERWIFPKGSADGDETPVAAAAREGMEEAGIEGRMHEDIQLEVHSVKQVDGTSADLSVTYIPMLVETQHEEWSERKKRRRHWNTLPEAYKIAGGPDITSALEKFEKSVPNFYKLDSTT
ncbi:MAG: NUDIX domain-containing protein [Parvibaculaceae bacterium]|nr:NUDIX domain-containing protein [Parvibaculaceae bacterium]